MKAPSTAANWISIGIRGEVPTTSSEDPVGGQCTNSTILPRPQGTSQGQHRVRRLTNQALRND